MLPVPCPLSDMNLESTQARLGAPFSQRVVHPLDKSALRVRRQPLNAFVVLTEDKEFHRGPRSSQPLQRKRILKFSSLFRAKLRGVTAPTAYNKLLMSLPLMVRGSRWQSNEEKML
jgi:hypothetical protein